MAYDPATDPDLPSEQEQRDFERYAEERGMRIVTDDTAKAEARPDLYTTDVNAPGYTQADIQRALAERGKTQDYVPEEAGGTAKRVETTSQPVNAPKTASSERAKGQQVDINKVQFVQPVQQRSQGATDQATQQQSLKKAPQQLTPSMKAEITRLMAGKEAEIARYNEQVKVARESALDVVPLAWLRNVKGMTPDQIVLYSSLDALLIFPVVGSLARGGRIGAVLGTKIVESDVMSRPISQVFKTAEQRFLINEAKREAATAVLFGDDAAKAFKATAQAERDYAKGLLELKQNRADRVDVIRELQKGNKAVAQRTGTFQTDYERNLQALKDLKARQTELTEKILPAQKDILNQRQAEYGNAIKEYTERGSGNLASPKMQRELAKIDKAIAEKRLEIEATKGKLVNERMLVKLEQKRANLLNRIGMPQVGYDTPSIQEIHKVLENSVLKKDYLAKHVEDAIFGLQTKESAIYEARQATSIIENSQPRIVTRKYTDARGNVITQQVAGGDADAITAKLNLTALQAKTDVRLAEQYRAVETEIRRVDRLIAEKKLDIPPTGYKMSDKRMLADLQKEKARLESVSNRIKTQLDETIKRLDVTAAGKEEGGRGGGRTLVRPPKTEGGITTRSGGGVKGGAGISAEAALARSGTTKTSYQAAKELGLEEDTGNADVRQVREPQRIGETKPTPSEIPYPDRQPIVTPGGEPAKEPARQNEPEPEATPGSKPGAKPGAGTKTGTTTGTGTGAAPTPRIIPKPIPKPQPKPAPQPQPKPAPLPEPEKEKLKTPTKTPVKPVEPITPMPTRIPLLSGKDDKKKRELIKKTKGAVTIRFGALHGKSVWHTFMPDGRRIVVIGDAPQGATIVTKGKGSAYATAQAVGGKIFTPIDAKFGAVRARIVPTGMGKGASVTFGTFKSVKRGRQFFTRVGESTLISRRPLNRRR